MAGFRPLVFLAAAAIAVSACESLPRAAPPRRPRETPRSPDTRIVGLVGTLSGPGSWRGEDAFEGADVGVNVLNRSLPRGQDRFELVTLDDEGRPRRAFRLIERFALDERTVGIIYAGPSEGLRETEPLLAKAGIPLLSSFADPARTPALSRHVFELATPLGWEANRIASYLLHDRRYLTIGALLDATPEGRATAAALRSALDRALTVEWYQPGSDDLTPALERLREQEAETVIIHGAPSDFTAALRALEAMGASYRSTSDARIASARSQRSPGAWAPQVVGFDDAISPGGFDRLPAGTVAAASLDRGVHYLPVASFERFREAYSNWWDGRPLGREQRGFAAALMLGWAAGTGSLDLAVALERMPSVRLGGGDVTLSRSDHVAGALREVGLWVVPRHGIEVAERKRLPSSLPWVPLARSFASGGRTRLQKKDWTELFEFIPPGGLAPRFQSMRFGVTTDRSDPVH